MQLMKFICAEIDDEEVRIPDSGCGEVDHIYLELYNHIGRSGEDIYFSIRNDGTVFFTEEQSEYFPDYWDQSKLIEIIRKKTDKAYSIDCGSCPECGELIIVDYIE
jgi:hypothetical protein